MEQGSRRVEHYIGVTFSLIIFQASVAAVSGLSHNRWGGGESLMTTTAIGGGHQGGYQRERRGEGGKGRW